jgi:hypothetical protein
VYTALSAAPIFVSLTVALMPPLRAVVFPATPQSVEKIESAADE